MRDLRVSGLVGEEEKSPVLGEMKDSPLPDDGQVVFDTLIVDELVLLEF